MSLFTPQSLDGLLIERDLFSLVKRERLARDTLDWDALADCYWDDSLVLVTWFRGTAAEFIQASREQVERGRGKGGHAIDPVRAAVVGDRATVESRGEIRVRAAVHDVPIDIMHWCRFFARAERADADAPWRMRTFDGIYGKDVMTPVRPGQAIPIDVALWESQRDSYRALGYLNAANGYPGNDALPGDDRPDLVKQFYGAAEDWLSGG